LFKSQSSIFNKQFNSPLNLIFTQKVLLHPVPTILPSTHKMQFLPATLLTLIPLISAIPLDIPQPSGPLGKILPTTLSNYFVSTGAIHFNTNEGHIMKHANTQSDQTTLLTFNVGPEYANRQCSFGFALNGPTDYTSGSNEFDLFCSLKPAEADAASWPSGNLRDHFHGRMNVDPMSKVGTWVEGVGGEAEVFPCPVGIFGVETVGVNDKVDIYWDKFGGSDGLHLVVYS
jgi:hypothetical protein